MRRALRRICVAAATVLLGLAPAAAEAGAPVPRVDSRVPPWLAPGGGLVVRGWARGDQQVELFAGSRRLAVARSGARGRFRLAARAPGPGRYRLAVEADGVRLPLGALRVRALVLAAVGDVTFGARVADAVRAYGPRYPWRSVARVLRRADVATGNLEGAVSTRGTPVPRKEFHFRGPPAALGAAARFAGIDVVSLANNHSLDFGRVAFLDTIRHARRFGIATAGGGADLAAARRPALVRAGGLRLALLGYSDVRPPDFDAGRHRPGAAPALPTLIGADVRRALRLADVTVVWFHWGIERSIVPSARQRALARAAFRAGASVVLGAHPHVLQPVERRGSSLVAWSLGNFVFGAHSPGTERTGILRIALGADGVRGRSFRPARIVGVQPRLL